MKKLHYLTTLCLIIPALIALASCTDQEQYVRISDASCAFLGEGNEPKTITVYSNPDPWQVKTIAPWITISEQKDNSFKITVSDYDGEEDRSATITVTSGPIEKTISVSQWPKDYKFPRYRFMDTFQYGTMMSPSGKYAGGFYSEFAPEGSGEKYYQYPVVIDLATGESKKLGPYPYSLYKLFQPMCIDDNGNLFIATESDATVRFTLSGDSDIIETPAGFTGMSNISQVSADGRIWVGWAQKNGVSTPLKWVDGVAEELKRPTKNFRGVDASKSLMQARGCSADGSIIYGTIWDDKDFALIYWDENGEVDLVGKDAYDQWDVEMPDGYGGKRVQHLANGMWSSATNTNISPNGEWIAGTYRTEEVDPDDPSALLVINCPAFYNTKTEKTYIFDELEGKNDYGGAGSTATNEGIGFTTDMILPPSNGNVVDIENKIILNSTAEWVEENYGLQIPIGFITYVPEGGKTVLGVSLSTAGATMEGINWFISPER